MAAGAAAVAGDLYGITHDLQAVALLLQVVGLAGVYALGAGGFGPGGVPAFTTALVGTLLWFGPSSSMAPVIPCLRGTRPISCIRPPTSMPSPRRWIRAAAG